MKHYLVVRKQEKKKKKRKRIGKFDLWPKSDALMFEGENGARSDAKRTQPVRLGTQSRSVLAGLERPRPTMDPAPAVPHSWPPPGTA
jgi:hypothetical protein